MEHDGEERAAGAEPRALTAEERDALAEALASRSLHGLSGALRTDTAARVHALRESDHPSALLVSWWDGCDADEFHAGTNLVVHARVGHDDYVREVLARPRRGYYRRIEPLVADVRDEMLIQRRSVDDLATLAEVAPHDVAALVDDGRVPSPNTLYRMLDALGLVATTIPPESLAAIDRAETGDSA